MYGSTVLTKPYISYSLEIGIYLAQLETIIIYYTPEEHCKNPPYALYSFNQIYCSLDDYEVHVLFLSGSLFIGVVFLQLSVCFSGFKEVISLVLLIFQTLKQNTEVRDGSDGSSKREISTQTPVPQTVSDIPVDKNHWITSPIRFHKYFIFILSRIILI